MDSISTLELTPQHWDIIYSDIAKQYPEEACGLVAGKFLQTILRAQLVFPVENVLHSPVVFRMDPLAQLKVLEQIEEQNLLLIGIYHSHPQGPDHPSEKDISEAAYPDLVHLIFSRTQGDWHCRAFRINVTDFHEVNLQITA